jgi:predicted HAD superfamily Cof-like phosphohydrolase
MNLYDHVENVKTFMTKAGQNVPKEMTTPSEADLKLRASLVMEEAMELVTKGLGLSVKFDGEKFSFEKVAEPDIVEAMDAAADIMWVGVTGVSIIFGADIVPVLEEVDRSNLSKFIDGYRRDDGKWVKGPSYSPADIKGVLKDGTITVE